jgi:hypothetical protein
VPVESRDYVPRQAVLTMENGIVRLVPGEQGSVSRRPTLTHSGQSPWLRVTATQTPPARQLYCSYVPLSRNDIVYELYELHLGSSR